MLYDTRNQCQSYPCPEDLCILEFKNENDMLHHVETENHHYAKIKTGMDKALLYYAQQKHVQNVCIEDPIPRFMEVEDDLITELHKIYFRGWARKVRTVGKISPKQRQFIETLFHSGASSKKKLSAEQMAEKMKNHTLDGHYYFSPSEYLQVSQIRSLINRIKQKKSPLQQFTVTNMPEDDGIEENLDEILDFLLHSEGSDDEDFEGFDGMD